GANINIGPRGTYANLGLPGTGLSYRTRLDQAERKPRSRASYPEAAPTPLIQSYDRTEYRSAAADSLSSPDLRPLADLIAEVNGRRRRLEHEIASTDRMLARADRRISIGRMLLLRSLVATIAEVRATLESQRLALAEQLASTAIDADFDVSEQSRAAFAELVQKFSVLRSCHAIWDISESARIDRARTRSAASEGVTRHK